MATNHEVGGSNPPGRTTFFSLKIKMLAKGEKPRSRYSVVQHGRANPTTYKQLGKNEFELKANFVRH